MSKKKTNGTSILGTKVSHSDYKSSKAITKIYYEKNYSKFTFLDDNRDIRESHVDKLAESISKKGQLTNVIVNEKMEVIEGQHRVKACEKLGVPVAYAIIPGASSKDVAIMNNTQKGWKSRDYLKHFSHSNHHNSSEYKKVQKFFEEYSLPIHTGLMILSGVTFKNRGNDRGPMPGFRAGSFKVKNLEKANEIGGQLMKLKSFAPTLVRVNKFCLAFMRISNLPGFSLETAYDQIDKYKKNFDRLGNQEDWDEAMVKTYNYRLRSTGKRKPKRIFLRKEVS